MNDIIPINNFSEEVLKLYNEAAREKAENHFSIAHRLLSDALAILPDSEPLLTARGLLFIKEFINPCKYSLPDDIKKALKINPGYWPALFFAAIINFNHLLTFESYYDMPNVINKFETILKNGGTIDEVFYYLVITNLLTGNKHQALEYFMKIKNFKTASRFYYYYSRKRNMDYPNFLNGTYYHISGEPHTFSLKEYEQYKKKKKNAIPSYISNYKDDLLNGQYISYYSGTDKISHETTYSKGLIHGAYKKYDESGILYSEEYYEHGILLKTEDYKNGILFKKSDFEHESLIKEEYYTNGILSKEVYYRNSKVISKNDKIPENEVVKHYDYKDGFVNRKEYYSNGVKTAEERFSLKNGLVSGIANFFKVSQTYLTAEIPYNDGKISGIVKKYNESGVITEEIEYNNGLIDGIYQKYYDNGNIYLKTGIYDLFDDEDVSFGFKADNVSYHANIIIGENEITNITKHSPGISVFYYPDGKLRKIYFFGQYNIDIDENGKII